MGINYSKLDIMCHDEVKNYNAAKMTVPSRVLKLAREFGAAWNVGRVASNLRCVSDIRSVRVV